MAFKIVQTIVYLFQVFDIMLFEDVMRRTYADQRLQHV